MKSMLGPLQLAATARGLDLITSFDPQIDVIARLALEQAKANGDMSGVQLDDDEEAGLVLGDEHRLRQIVTNLTR